MKRHLIVELVDTQERGVLGMYDPKTIRVACGRRMRLYGVRYEGHATVDASGTDCLVCRKTAVWKERRCG